MATALAADLAAGALGANQQRILHVQMQAQKVPFVFGAHQFIALGHAKDFRQNALAHGAALLPQNPSRHQLP